MNSNASLIPKATTEDGIPVWCGHDEVAALDTLVEHPDNSNTHPESQLDILGEIIERNGWREPITVSRLTGRITKGHGRRLAAMRKGWRFGPVAYQDYATEEDEIADVIADNRAGELSRRDKDKLKAQLERFRESGRDVGSAGFTAREVTNLKQMLRARDRVAAGYKPFWGIVVTCDGEADQRELLERFNAEGLKCRALIS